VARQARLADGQGVSRKGCLACFVAGVLATPAVLVSWIWIDEQRSPGLAIECRGLLPQGGICRYTTGDIETTPRWKAGLRWQWHKRVVHRKRGQSRG
jgi:hypothetical protein